MNKIIQTIEEKIEFYNHGNNTCSITLKRKTCEKGKLRYYSSHFSMHTDSNCYSTFDHLGFFDKFPVDMPIREVLMKLDKKILMKISKTGDLSCCTLDKEKRIDSFLSDLKEVAGR